MVLFNPTSYSHVFLVSSGSYLGLDIHRFSIVEVIVIVPIWLNMLMQVMFLLHSCTLSSTVAPGFDFGQRPSVDKTSVVTCSLTSKGKKTNKTITATITKNIQKKTLNKKKKKNPTKNTCV